MTCTDSATLPLVAAVKVMVSVPVPDVMLPPVIVQTYVVPAGPAGTEAVLPADSAVTVDAEVIFAIGAGVTAMSFVDDALQPDAVATLTL